MPTAVNGSKNARPPRKRNGRPRFATSKGVNCGACCWLQWRGATWKSGNLSDSRPADAKVSHEKMRPKFGPIFCVHLCQDMAANERRTPQPIAPSDRTPNDEKPLRNAQKVHVRRPNVMPAGRPPKPVGTALGHRK